VSAVTAPPSAPSAQTTSRRKHLSDRARAERRLAYWLVAPAAIVMVAVTAYPIIDAVALSLQRADLRFPNATKFIGLSNYGHVLTAPVWWQDVFHTVILTVISVSIQLVLGMCLALVMHRIIFGRGLVRAIALVPYAIVAVVAAESWQLAFSLQSGWIPKLLGLSGDPLSHTFGTYVAIIFNQGAQGTESISILNYNTLLDRLNLGLGSAVSVLLFLLVALIAIVFIVGLGAGRAPSTEAA